MVRFKLLDIKSEIVWGESLRKTLLRPFGVSDKILYPKIFNLTWPILQTTLEMLVLVELTGK